MARGVSLPAETFEKVDRRLQQLKPAVKGWSHYVQLLVDWDLKHPGRDDKETSFPFNQPDCPDSGYQLAA